MQLLGSRQLITYKVLVSVVRQKAIISYALEAAEGPKVCGGGHCVLKQGFTRSFPRIQDVTVKLKYELIFIKF